MRIVVGAEAVRVKDAKVIAFRKETKRKNDKMPQRTQYRTRPLYWQNLKGYEVNMALNIVMAPLHWAHLNVFTRLLV
jgi:hypothetical protein